MFDRRHFLRVGAASLSVSVSGWLAPERTLHMSSFTKLIAPGVRTGFMIGDPSLVRIVKGPRFHRVAQEFAFPFSACHVHGQPYVRSCQFDVRDECETVPVFDLDRRDMKSEGRSTRRMTCLMKGQRAQGDRVGTLKHDVHIVRAPRVPVTDLGVVSRLNFWHELQTSHMR